ncbi:MAG TPA: tRNA (adenosine(37)-N6)-dimethylallyltransferase MiaA [Chitinophagaceae bacterium]|nr:tRNA (adenosine(37)-N6)-dimethylallyltransferase MiaA [Chitinophagaceae bacterium]
MSDINIVDSTPAGGTVIVIAGPTASGKTALSLQLAQYLDTEIISADSRQCFRELNIGVAKPSAEELGQVKHYFINSHSIHDNVNAQTFEEYALKATREILSKRPFAVMVGGTGLYIKAFCEGLDEMPAIDERIRESIVSQYNIYGISWLQQQLQAADPVYWQSGEQQNPHRLMRALEVKLGTGKSITSFQKGEAVKRPFNIIKIGIDLPRNQLYDNINARVDGMIREGLQAEAQNLLPLRHLNALQTVGYKEFFDFFDGKISVETAINEVKKNTRHYAKRQLTWFKKDSSVIWKPAFSVDFIGSILENSPWR